MPFNFSPRGKICGHVVFAGYGITAPEYNYDDYAGIDVKGKIVLILRHEPQEFDEKSVFEGKVYTEHAQFSSKASNAKMHGARGVILVNDLHAHPGDTDELEPFGAPTDPPMPEFPSSRSRPKWRRQLVRGRRQESGRHRNRHRQGPEAALVRLSGDRDHARSTSTWSVC